MLNPELFEVFGNESRKFFDELSNALEESVLNICYAIKGAMIRSGECYSPWFLGVLTDDSNIADTVSDVSIDISFKLVDRNYDKDIATVCIPCTKEKIDKEGVKIWVV